MPLRIRLPAKPSLLQLSHQLQAVADDTHQANELRSDGRTLYVKLRSACGFSSRESVRNDHRRRAVALVGAGLAADLADLGASALKDQLLRKFLPEGGAGRPAPVRVADVLALERVVARAHELAATLPGLTAVNQAMAAVWQARTAASPPPPGTQGTQGKTRGITPSWSTSRSSQPSVSIATPYTASRAGTPVSIPALESMPLGQRAAEFLHLAEHIARPPVPSAGSNGDERVLPKEFLALAASFSTGDLLSPGELARHEAFLRQATPLLQTTAPAWQTMPVEALQRVVEQLVHLHRACHGYETVEVQFTSQLRDAPALSGDGTQVLLPTGRPDNIDHFDEFVHHLVHGLTLRYQHHLATRLPVIAPGEQILARIMRASQRVPMDRRSLVQQFGMPWSQARQAWLASPSRRHATALADLVSARAYAALPDDDARLPRMARLGRRR